MKKGKVKPQLEPEPKKIVDIDHINLVDDWLRGCRIKFDYRTIKNVGHDKFRVNLFTKHGDIIQTSNLFKSFYLSIEDKTVKDKSR